MHRKPRQQPPKPNHKAGAVAVVEAEAAEADATKVARRRAEVIQVEAIRAAPARVPAKAETIVAGAVHHAIRIAWISRHARSRVHFPSLHALRMCVASKRREV